MGKFNLLLGIFLTVMFLALGFCSSQVQAGELLRYTFDDGTANDSVGSFHGSFVGNATVVDDPERGKVLSLDGGDDAVDVPAIGSYSEFTIGMWMYSRDDPSALQFSGGYNTDVWDPQGVHLKNNYGNVNVGIEGRPDVTGTIVLPQDAWRYIAVTLTNTELAVYVGDSEGGIVKDNSVTLDNPVSGNLFEAQIGAWNSTRELNGMIDDFRVYDHALSLSELSSAIRPKAPLLVFPVDEENVNWDLTLEWSAPAEGAPTAYQVYLDPNLTYVQAAGEGVSGNPLFLNVAVESGLTYNVTNLAHGVRYYWKVEPRFDPVTTPPNDPNWGPSSFMATFTTLPDNPVIESQTAYQLVTEGEDAIFTVVSSNTDSYQWYKDGDLLGAGDPNYTGVTDSSLVVLAANLDDEGDYHCVLSNGAGDTPSVPASLLIKKLIGHWPFDGNLNDVVGGNHGSATDPNFVAGIVGSQAVKFTVETAVDDPVTIPTAAHTNTAWTLSWWEESDLSQAGGNWETMIGNGDDVSGDGWEVFEFGRYYSDRYAFGFNIGGGYLYTPDDDRYPRGQWHHHVVAYDPETKIAAWHINGVPFTNFADVNFTAFYPEFYVGNVGGLSQPYPGNIDDLRLYNYPLDAYEIAKLYTDVVGGWVCLEPISVSEGDLNQDCVIDMIDFAMFISEWLACGLYPPTGCP